RARARDRGPRHRHRRPQGRRRNPHARHRGRNGRPGSRRKDQPMSFNLSDWALKHRSFVWFLMIVSLVAGALAYINLGREEDPSVSIKTMVVTAQMPGATTAEMLEQVTKRIENKLEELDELDFTRSETSPGVSVVYIDLKPTI